MELSRTHGPQQGAALMKRSTKHVALDVHQATTLASVREDSGRVIARSILPTEEPAIVEFFRGMRGTIHVAFEEGTQAQWLHELPDGGARVRAAALYAELDVLRTLRPQAKAAMLAAAQQDPGWTVLRTIPCFGPVRVALLLATMQTPWRFRTKRNLWAYAGLAVVTHSTADYELVAGRPQRRCRAPLTRGLNRNHNRVLKEVFKGAATAAKARPGPLQDWYDGLVARGMREELARVTLARKLAAITLRLWKKGERYDPTQLTTPAR